MKPNFKTYQEYLDYLSKQKDFWGQMSVLVSLTACMITGLLIIIAVLSKPCVAWFIILVIAIAGGTLVHTYDKVRDYKDVHSNLKEARSLNGVECLLMSGPESVAFYPLDKTETHTFVFSHVFTDSINKYSHNNIPRDSATIPTEADWQVSEVNILRQVTTKVAYFSNKVKKIAVDKDGKETEKLIDKEETRQFPFLVFFWPKEMSGLFMDEVSKMHNQHLDNKT